MNTIHPTATIGSEVTLGSNNMIGPGVVIAGPVVIGSGNWIGANVVIGGPGEIHGAAHGPDWLDHFDGPGVEIGDNNVVRELTVVHQGSHRPTRIGNDCFIMTNSHVAHDVQVGDSVTISPQTVLGGHALIGQWVTIGIHTSVHQFRVVGPGVMLGMGSVVTKDLPPFALAYGSPARIKGANVVGMSRRGLLANLIEDLDQAFRSGIEPPMAVVEAESVRALFEWYRAAQVSNQR